MIPNFGLRNWYNYRMIYRRNADIRLREMEREYSATGDKSLLHPINIVRRRAGLPPHDDARIIVANDFLFDAFPRLANVITTFIETDTDIAEMLYLDEDMEEPHPLHDHLIALTNEIQRLETEWRIVSREVGSAAMGQDSDPEYVTLLARHGLSPTQLGPEIDVEDEGEFAIRMVSRHSYREGYRDRANALGFMFRVVCERASRIFRKLMVLGVVDVAQMLAEDPEMADEWEDWPLGNMDSIMDNIEIAYQEIGDVSLGLHPRPDAIEMFSGDWYGEN